MLHPFWFARRTRRVQNEKRVFGIDRHGFAVGALPFHELMHPDVAAVLPLNATATTAINNDMAHALCSCLAQSLVDGALEGNIAPTTLLLVGSDHQRRTHINAAFVQAFGRKPPEDNRVRDT